MEDQPSRLGDHGRYHAYFVPIRSRDFMKERFDRWQFGIADILLASVLVLPPAICFGRSHGHQSEVLSLWSTLLQILAPPAMYIAILSWASLTRWFASRTRENPKWVSRSLAFGAFYGSVYFVTGILPHGIYLGVCDTLFDWLREGCQALATLASFGSLIGLTVGVFTERKRKSTAGPAG